MHEFNSVKDLVDEAVKAGKNISDLILEAQALEMGRSKSEIFNDMAKNLKIMQEAVNKGIESNKKSLSGLSGGDAYKMQQAVEKGRTLSGHMLGGILAKALAVAEVNASMGRIVAAPTAGSCGILPAVLITVMHQKEIPEEKVVMAMFTAGGIGLVIDKQASTSGADGGCQAECGTAAAMAAAALVELSGGSPQMISSACAISLKNIIGLVCDPVAGLVEVPCIKRNASGAANALISAELALAGIESKIPADEVIGAINSVSNLMSPALKETAEGGLATTPTGCRLAKEIFGDL